MNRYALPTMREIRDLPWNGLKVASLFAGGGGSSTGYRMAGYRVVFASEFVEEAARTYGENAAPHTVIDRKDVRELTGADVLAATGLAVGELDVLDGSPPCSSFSMAGRRESGWGKEKAYSTGQVQRTDDLFFDYARLVNDIQPKAFVAENVSGLVRGTAKGYFIEILTALRACGYRVQAQLLDASWLGVPQQRQRLIIAGVRNDLDLDPAFPRPFERRFTLGDVLPACQEGGVIVQRNFGGEGITVHNANDVAPTVMAGGIGGVAIGQAVMCQPFEGPGVLWDNRTPYCPETHKDLTHSLTVRKGLTFQAPEGMVTRLLSIPEIKRLCSFPADFKLTGTHTQRWERLGRAVPPLMMQAVAATVAEEVLCAV